MIVRFGLQLITRSGRETRGRLIAIIGGVGVGILIFLFALSWLYALQSMQKRPCWSECNMYPQSSSTTATHPLLWREYQDEYLGSKIQRVDIAKTGLTTLAIPGVKTLPQPGQYIASPALQELLANKANSVLRARFPGSDVGTIGAQGLKKPE